MSAEVAHIGWLGFLIFGIVEGSMFFVILATVLGKPMRPRLKLTILGTLATLVGAFVAVFAAGAALLSLFVP